VEERKDFHECAGLSDHKDRFGYIGPDDSLYDPFGASTVEP